MKKAILVVSFGTTWREARRTCIAPVEDELFAAFPDRAPARAYTSRFIVRRLQAQGEDIPGEAEALEALRAAGCGDILVACTHMIPGEEYERAAALAEGCRVTRPLLDAEADLERMASLLGGVAREEGRPLVLMGHGTDHAADGVYARLRSKLPEGVFLACVEGSHGLAELLPALDALPEKRVTVMPLMLVAGDHAHNDLAGDGPDSWKSVLAARGFDVRPRLQGLGALAEVRRMYVEKARRSVDS